MSEILLGTQGWQCGSWVGPFYPNGARKIDMLHYYSRAFPTVEVDSTFHAIPASPVVESWRERVPPGFTFALRVPQRITHEQRLEDVAEVLERFLGRATLLEDRLGPFLIQLSPGFRATVEHRRRFEAFVRGLPRDHQWAVEFRSSDWIDEGMLTFLERHDVAVALVDGRWIGRRTMQELCNRPTASFAYVRWMGGSRRFADFSRVQEPADRTLTLWQDTIAALRVRVHTIYGYVNNNLQGHAPHSARELQRIAGIRPVEPGALRAQRELF